MHLGPLFLLAPEEQIIGGPQNPILHGRGSSPEYPERMTRKYPERLVTIGSYLYLGQWERVFGGGCPFHTIDSMFS